MSSSPIRRVVTGHDLEGKAIITSDGDLPTAVKLAQLPGTVFHEVWNAQGSPALVGKGPDRRLARYACRLPPTQHAFALSTFRPIQKISLRKARRKCTTRSQRSATRAPRLSKPILRIRRCIAPSRSTTAS